MTLGCPYAYLLWHPAYPDRVSDKLVEFVNDLGQKWHQSQMWKMVRMTSPKSTRR